MVSNIIFDLPNWIIRIMHTALHSVCDILMKTYRPSLSWGRKK